MSRGTRREIVSWSLYDFAISAFNTLVITFIFSRYFTEAIASDAVTGGILWTRAVNVSSILVALMTPVLGAIADFSGRKKQFLIVSTLVCAIATVGLYFMQSSMVFLALAIFVVANVAFESGQVFYNGFLPEISTSENTGRISGLGQGLGYIGGLLSLIVALGMVRLWLPDEGGLNVRATNLLVTGWVLLFSIPVFRNLRERGERRSASLSTYVRIGFGRVADTFRHLRSYREAAMLLVARLVYNDGLVTVFSMASIYIGAVYGLAWEQLIVLAIVVNLFAGLSAVAFGFVTDRIGGKRTIAFTLVVLLFATIYGAWAPTIGHFWVAAILVGMMVGPNQAASRSLLGQLIPEQKHGEMFGFYAFSGRLSAVLGPLTFGLVLAATGNYRIAMATIAVFFVVGLLLLALVREEEGMELARRMSKEARPANL